MTSRLFFFVVLLLALFFASPARAVKVAIAPDGRECVTVHATRVADTFSGFLTASSPDLDPRSYYGAFDLVVIDDEDNVAFQKNRVNDHKFEFESERAGAHEFCIHNRDHATRTVVYDVLVGHHFAHDAATRETVTDLEAAIISLKYITNEVRAEMEYQKERDRHHRANADSIAAKVTGYALLQAAALVGASAWNVAFVKGLFESKFGALGARHGGRGV